jgi:O-antigen chain-terminating methyltransferase
MARGESKFVLPNTSDHAVPDSDALHGMQAGLETHAQHIGSLPPTPKTLRGYVGSSLIRGMNRLLWWQLTVQKNFAHAVGEVTRPLVEQYAAVTAATASMQQQELQLQHSQERVANIEQVTQELQRSSTESRVIAEDLRLRVSAVAEMAATHRQKAESIEQHAQFVNTRITGVESTLQFAAARLAAAEAAVQAANAETQKLWAALAAEIGARESTDKRVLHALEVATDAAEARAGSGQEQIADTLYVALQDRFRGSREQIRAWQRVYLPALHDNGIGTAETPILDLGCGRGEWLQLLQSDGLIAKGVDSNPLMVEACSAMGLNVAKQDSVLHLAETPANSIGAVTAFHLIEHLPFSLLIRLIDSAFRVLKPGGLLLLETPNPANVFVGSHTFYLDPTHVKPIPSELLWFIIESRGFHKLRLIELHPSELSSDEAVQLPESIARAFQAGRDYSIIGERP